MGKVLSDRTHIQKDFYQGFSPSGVPVSHTSEMKIKHGGAKRGAEEGDANRN